jgi:hypothetical protein
MKSYKICGRNWYPALMEFQMGFHLVSVPCIIGVLIYFILGNFCWSAVALLGLCLLMVLASFLWAFDDELADQIDKGGWPSIELF